MLFQLATIASIFFAHGEITETNLGTSKPTTVKETVMTAPQRTVVEKQQSGMEFNIHRVEPKNVAVVASKNADQVSVGEEFSIETPYGDCHVLVTKVIEDYFYLDTQQCQREFISQGTALHSTRKVKVITTTEKVPVTPMGETLTDGPEWQQSEFYQNYIKNRASAYISYYTGNTLSGSIVYANSNTVEDLKGSNAIGLGLDYKVADIPYNMSVLAGFAYALPRSFGSYYQSTTTSAGRVDFGTNPELQMASLFLDVRYNFNDKVYGVLGLNRLFTRLSKYPGEMSGDFGFHVGARYYPTDRLKPLFVDGTVNFYNMNYQYQSAKADFSLTELEIKAGYTF